MSRLYYVLLVGFRCVLLYMYVRCYLVWNCSPVWPTYCRGQSMHFHFIYVYRWYRIFCFCIVFVLDVFGDIGASKAVSMSVSLNILVIRFVSCPKYVNMIHLVCLRVFSFVCYWFVVVLFLFKFCSIGVYILYWSCCSVQFIVLFSVFLSFHFMGCICSLLTIKLMADILYCVGSHDVLCITKSVALGYSYMLYDRLFSVLCTVMSRKLILLFCYLFMVNCEFDWILLNSSSVWFM
jgi:hypothetical protein